MWALAVVVIAAVQWPTLRLSPATWQDEVQIVEIGRLVFEPSSPWSAALGRDLTPVPALSYLGGAIHEGLYRLTGTAASIRILGVLAAIVSSGVLLAWLLRRGTIGWIAIALSLLYLIDPGFERSYRGGRLEALVFLCTFLGCWAVRTAVDARSERHRSGVLALAGCAGGVMVWLWTTAVVLLPLIGLELWMATADARDTRTTRLATLRPLGAGLAAGLLLPILPVVSYVWAAASATVSHLLWDSAAAANPAAAGGGLIRSVIGTVQYSPFLPLLALPGLLARRHRAMAVTMVALLVVILATRFYLYRYLYVLPYLMPLAAAGLTHLAVTSPRARVVRGITIGGLVVAIGWAAALSLVGRTTIATEERPWREPAGLVEMLRREVGEGPLRVYAGTLDVYFAGRSLGWHMASNKFQLEPAVMDQLLARCEVLVMLPHEATPLFMAQVARLGFDEGRRVHTGPFEQPQEFQTPRYGGVAYGPYTIFVRRRAADPTSR